MSIAHSLYIPILRMLFLYEYSFTILRFQRNRIIYQLIHSGESRRMPPKWTSTSEYTAITLDAIRQLIADLTTAVEAQTAAIASTSNPNNLSGTPTVKMGNYKEFINCQPF
ncbi:hypothetical protein Tco_1090046 [Tanacetum coccineum]|uniref:Uncharacterized protein n=1 Tax=Tanacetum coccineum TaxID=301880 RepID=A0ABQ5I397_9ASTR